MSTYFVIHFTVNIRANFRARNIREVLSNHLRGRLGRMEENTRWQNWPSLHLARWQAYELLVESQLN